MLKSRAFYTLPESEQEAILTFPVETFTEKLLQTDRNFHREIAKDFGVKLLGAGATRTAFQLTKLLVIKISTGRRHYSQSRVEWRAWIKYQDTKVGRFLLPMLAFETVDTSTEFSNALFTFKVKMHKKEEIAYAVADALQEEIQHCMKGKRWIHDIHSANVGVLGKEIVVLDYGFLE